MHDCIEALNSAACNSSTRVSLSLSLSFSFWGLKEAQTPLEQQPFPRAQRFAFGSTSNGSNSWENKARRRVLQPVQKGETCRRGKDFGRRLKTQTPEEETGMIKSETHH